MFGDQGLDELKKKLDILKKEHRALDSEVEALHANGVMDQLKVVRLKKRKLYLKDEIMRLEDQLNPDIIA